MNQSTRFTLYLSDFFTDTETCSVDTLCITERGYEVINSLCNVILNKYFYEVRKVDREDLIQVGIVKCLELLNKGVYDPKRARLENYFYAGIRNEMKNYLYRTGKESIIEDTVLYGIHESKEIVEDIEMSIAIIQIDSLDGYAMLERYDEGIVDKSLSSLKDMGFKVSTDLSDTKGYYPESDRLTALIIWEHLQNI